MIEKLASRSKEQSMNPNQNRPLKSAQELDDIDAYVASFNEQEQQELVDAEAAIDLAIMLYRARERKHLSQAEAAGLAGLQQQAVSRFERPGANPRLDTMQSYLSALGYSLELNIIDSETGERAASLALAPARR
jgi:DNA-binding XRE family transcriptional regulator